MNQNASRVSIRWKKYKFTLLYIMLIVYIGIQPSIRLLNYIGVNLDIKQGILYIFLLFVYAFICILKKKSEIRLNYILEIFLIVLVSSMYIISITYVKEYTPIYVDGDNGVEYVTGISRLVSFFKNNFVFYFVFMLLGMNLDKLYNYMKQKSIKKITKLVYYGMVFILIIVSIEKDISLSNVIFEKNLDNGYYLYIGDTFFIMSIIVYFLAKNKLLYITNSFFWLYKIGSRTSLLCFIAFSILTFIFYVKNNKISVLRKSYSIILILFLFICSIMFVPKLSDNSTVLDARMIAIFSTNQIEQDSSFNSRKDISQKNINDLHNIWFMGRVLREFDISASIGAYSHNLLSYWIEFGILPFILIIYLVIRVIFIAVKGFLYKDKFLDFSIIVILSLMPAALFIRGYAFPYIWFIVFAGRNLYLKIKDIKN